MANRCDCCGCVLESDYGTSTVAGSGTTTDPFTVTRTDPAFIRPMARVTRVAVLGGVPNNTPTPVPFDTEVFDTDMMWVIGTPTLITFQKAGLFSFGASWSWPSNTTGQRFGFLTVFRGATVITTINEAVQTTTGDLRRQLNYQWYVEIGDTLRLDVAQTSGGALNLNSGVAMWALYHGRKV